MLKLRDIIIDVTKISEDESINSENYLEALSYISRLNRFLQLISPILHGEDFTFLPTFKGMQTSSKYGIYYDDREAQMKKFVIVSPLFLEDVKIRETEDILIRYSNYIKFEDNKVTIELR